MAKSNLHDLEVIYQTETPSAVCVRETEDSKDVWIPKARCEVYPLDDMGHLMRGKACQLTADENILIEKGLV